MSSTLTPLAPDITAASAPPAAIDGAALTRARREYSQLQVDAAELAVSDRESFDLADAFLGAVKAYRKRIADWINPVIGAWHAGHKASVALRESLDGPAATLETTLKRRLGDYEQEQQRKLRAAEAAAAVERQRLEDEARLQAALAADAAGDAQQAEAILTAPAPPMPVVAPPPAPVEIPRAQGLSFRTTYSAEVTDLGALIRAVAAGQAPIAYLQANLPALNGAARAHKEVFSVPGVRLVTERTSAKRA